MRAMPEDWNAVRARLAAMERYEDPATIRHLEWLGVAGGWHCLEVGGGGGSIAAWLCRKVGASGRILVTDLDTRALDGLRYPQAEATRHDAVTDEFERQAFDLVHTRNVLVHIPGRDGVLAKLAAAVRPGGWILIEEPDVITDSPDPEAPAPLRELYARVTGAIYAFLAEQGLDPNYGSRVFGHLRELGFERLHAEGRTIMCAGGAPGAMTPHRLAFTGLRDAITGDGRVEGEDFDRFLALYDDPRFAWREALGMATWGRRPA